MESTSPLYRVSFSYTDLCDRYAVRFRHPHKVEILNRACPEGWQSDGTVTVSRWFEMPLPARLPRTNDLVASSQPDLFNYPASAPDSLHWHFNFADRDLFAYYGGPLLAQDELQVLEHPALGSVREALLATDKSTLVTDGHQPTPILVRGVQRRLGFDTAPTTHNPNGLYGKRFAEADLEKVLDAMEVLDPPTTSCILAMQAPAYGSGEYRAEEIRSTLAIAFTGFQAAVIETKHALGDKARTVIHSGFWGCGAYGGNRVLMTALQLLASRLASVDELVYHTFDEAGLEDFRESQVVFEEVARPGQPVADVIDTLVSKGFRWGVSDGN